ncbi:MAG: hypothetical protein ACE5HX_12640 [bacterium]
MLFAFARIPCPDCIVTAGMNGGANYVAISLETPQLAAGSFI